MAYIGNWRDFQPEIAHLSAVHWGGLRTRGGGSSDERDCLEQLGGFARHALQGRKTSDYHKHENTEQVYYILNGSGEVLFDNKRYLVKSGDAIYLPSGEYHQMFNDMNETWLEHHVISMSVEGNGGKFTIRNWNQVPPHGDGVGAIRWRQLGYKGAEEINCLRGMCFIDREAVQPDNEAIERYYEDIEQVYYVLENRGILQSNGEKQEMTEGDMVHIPMGMPYKILNPYQEWLSCLIIAG